MSLEDLRRLVGLKGDQFQKVENDLPQRAHEHLIEPQRIRAILCYDVVRIDYISTTLTHFVSP